MMPHRLEEPRELRSNRKARPISVDEAGFLYLTFDEVR
jgi:hypothetical protein